MKWVSYLDRDEVGLGACLPVVDWSRSFPGLTLDGFRSGFVLMFGLNCHLPFAVRVRLVVKPSADPFSDLN